jgi:ATP-dependent DNA helicase RecQ
VSAVHGKPVLGHQVLAQGLCRGAMQMLHAAAAHALQMKMRVAGLPVAHVLIDEAVARRAGVSVPQLRQLLYGLSVNHVVRYIPADHATVLLIAHDRLRPGNVQLSPQRYKMLRSTYGERVQTMLDFVEEEHECRSQFLLRYFGQSESAPCGKCDICRSGAARPAKLRERLLEWVRAREGKYTLHEVRGSFGPEDDEALEVLRELIDHGEVPPYTE